MHVAPGFTVLTGAELTVADGADIIVIGPIEALQWLDRQFSPSLNEGYFPPLAEVIEPAHRAGLLLIGAHPTRLGKRLIDVEENVIRQLDALEINGKDMAEGPVDKTVTAWAQRLGLPVVASSDAHLWPQVGVQRTVLPLSELTLDGLRHALAAGQVKVESAANTHGIVRVCQIHKRLIKVSLARRRRHIRRPSAHIRPTTARAAAGV